MAPADDEDALERLIHHHQSESRRHALESRRHREIAETLLEAHRKMRGIGDVSAYGSADRVFNAPTTQVAVDRRRRRSKYERLIIAWEEASSGRPLDHEEMAKIAESILFPIDRSVMRSVIHEQLKLGRTTRTSDNRYVWGKTQTASAGEEDAV